MANINDFKSAKLAGGGARPNQFKGNYAFSWLLASWWRDRRVSVLM